MPPTNWIANHSYTEHSFQIRCLAGKHGTPDGVRKMLERLATINMTPLRCALSDSFRIKEKTVTEPSSIIFVIQIRDT